MPTVILNRLHQHNRNLILIGDLNARHRNWHNVISDSCGRRLARWIDGKQNLNIFNSSQRTSTQSQAVIDLIIAPSHVSSELAESDQKMRVIDHFPVHWRLSSSISHSSTEFGLKIIEWVLLNYILYPKKTFFFARSEQNR